MGKITINSYADFEQFVGKEIGASGYLKITQEMIDKFADATLDHQWIHTDVEKAKIESPFKSTIAHGYLTLSVLPHLWNQIADVNNTKMQVNYGIEKLKFNKPVLAGEEVRLVAKLVELTDLRGIVRATIDAKLEVKDSPKNAYEAKIIFLYHFNK